MRKERFCILDTDGGRYTVNVDYVIAFREDVMKPEKGGILFVADGKSDGGRLALTIPPEEVDSVREWLHSQ